MYSGGRKLSARDRRSNSKSARPAFEHRMPMERLAGRQQRKYLHARMAVRFYRQPLGPAANHLAGVGDEQAFLEGVRFIENGQGDSQPKLYGRDRAPRISARGDVLPGSHGDRALGFVQTGHDYSAASLSEGSAPSSNACS